MRCPEPTAAPWEGLTLPSSPGCPHPHPGGGGGGNALTSRPSTRSPALPLPTAHTWQLRNPMGTVPLFCNAPHTALSPPPSPHTLRTGPQLCCTSPPPPLTSGSHLRGPSGAARRGATRSRTASRSAAPNSADQRREAQNPERAAKYRGTGLLPPPPNPTAPG